MTDTQRRGNATLDPPTSPARPSGRSSLTALPREPENIVERHHLNELLSSFESLAVVHAPLGFGKTTLVSSWAASAHRSATTIVWFDAKRTDENSFWHDALTAFTEAGVIMPDNASSPFNRISTALHAPPAAVTLIIDGYDAVSSSTQIAEDLHDLLVRRRRLRVIVCLRGARIFSSALWSDLKMVVIGAPDLLFDHRDTTRLAELFGTSQSSETTAMIHDAFRGWPEPTRAVIGQLRRPGRTVTDARVVADRVARDFLTTRVLPQFTGHRWRRFLFAISVPQSVTGELAAFVSGDHEAPGRLHRLESEGLLVATAIGDDVVYRWPDAARTALYEEFMRRDPAGIRAVHGRSALWHLEREEAADALEHADLAQDPELLVQVVERCWPRLLDTRVMELRTALSSVPIASLKKHPGAAAVRDILLHLQPHPDDLFLSIVEPGPGHRADVARTARSERARAALTSLEAIMIALRGRGRFRHALRYADAIETICRIGREYQTDDIAPLAPGVLLQNGITRLVGNDLAGALADFEYSYNRSEEGVNPYAERDAAGKAALVHALTGDTQSALAWLSRYHATAQPAGWVAKTISQSAAIASAIIAMERLDRERAASIVTELEVPLDHEQTWGPFLTYAQARYALIWGDRRDALGRVEHERTRRAEWTQDGSSANALLFALEADVLMSLGLGNRARELLERAPRHPALFAIRARFALLTGDGETAMDATRTGTRDAVSMTVRTELLLVRAIAQWEGGHTHAAMDSLRDAVKVAQSSGSTYAFAAASERLAPLAERDADAARLLKAARASVSSPIYPARLELLGLTERENLVLDRIARGMTMREMAGDLFVSYNTVKSQTRSLYQKLGASSREQALARAYEHGLLEERED